MYIYMYAYISSLSFETCFNHAVLFDLKMQSKRKSTEK